jgi:hypothetical protein
MSSVPTNSADCIKTIHTFINKKDAVRVHLQANALNAFENASFEACKGLSAEEIAKRQYDSNKASEMFDNFSKMTQQTLMFFEYHDKMVFGANRACNARNAYNA